VHLPLHVYGLVLYTIVVPCNYKGHGQRQGPCSLNGIVTNVRFWHIVREDYKNMIKNFIQTLEDYLMGSQRVHNFNLQICK
jgi:hypothetical protein